VDGFLRATDLEGYEPEWVDPLEADYRGHTVRVMPPNSFGLFMLLQLRALAEIDLTRLESGSPERFRHLIAATRAAFAEGRRFVADPNFGAPDVSEALGAEMTRRLQDAVAAGGAALQMSNQGGTAVISVADPEGNGITLVQSVFTPFGSAVADAETGIVLNDRMIGFTMEPGHPNEVAPGKRPAHTLNPVMVMEGERLRFLLGTPGGPGQTVTLTQVLSNLVDLEMNISEAVHTPRWSQGRQGEPLVEADVPGDVVPTLEAAGIPVSTIEGGSPFFGSAEGIEIGSDGVLRGAVDHRREAFALGA
jgi:gamma-glutamyltranspeptidase/glutathione hydrolase